MELSKIDWRNEYEVQLQFETLLTGISTQFINLPSGPIDSVIEEAQGQICRCLDIDLSTLWQWSEESPRSMTLTHLHNPPDGPSRPEINDAAKSFPWVLKKVLQRETLVLFTDKMPPEAAIDQESRRHFGVKSSVVVPLAVGANPVIGFLTFDALWEERVWPNGLVKKLELVAQIFCNALVREESDRTLRESEARLASVMLIADMGFYEMNENNRVIFLDDTIRTILGITPECEQDGREFWLAHVHPEELPHILEQSRQMIEKGVDRYALEYRYMNPERGMIWVHHLSRVMTRDVEGRSTRIIGIMQDITDRKNLEVKHLEREAHLRDSQKDLHQITRRLISAKEQELRRLSCELHDDLTQRLAALAIEAGKLELKLSENEGQLHESSMISSVKDGLIKISEDVHRIARQLHPTILDDLGLIRAIESECAAFELRENIEIIFTKEDVPDKFPEDVPLCLYRIVQEGLNNIINHSGAKRCEIFLKGAAETIRLTVKDKGIGFDPVEVRKKQGLGLASMRERVQLVKGDLSIETKPGKGTIIQVSMPLKGEGKHAATTHTSC